MPSFDIVQSEAELEVRFQPRLWSLIHDVPRFYESLLSNLSACHLSANDLRPEAGSSVGGSTLSFWLFNFNVNVTIRLEGFSVRCGQLRLVTREQLLQVLDGIIAAIGQAAGGNLSALGATVAYSGHGQIQGDQGLEVIGRFTTPGPAVEGFGEKNGAGAAFYYGEAAPLLSSALTVDVSRVVPGGVFVRVVLALAAGMSNATLIDVAVDRVRAAFAALDLQEASPWS